MEPTLNLQYNGQSCQSTDLNSMGDSAGHADDRTLQELLRMREYDAVRASRAIMPYGTEVQGSGGALIQGTVVPGTGGVYVFPFRAVIGSRAVAVAGDAASAKTAYRDIRTAVYAGSSTLQPEAALIPITNGGGGNVCVLVYAKVSIDVAVTSTTRKVKDTTARTISVASVNPLLTTKVTILTTQGTANDASGHFIPGETSSGSAGLPADSGTDWYIPLAYVRAVAGAGAGTVYTSADIVNIAPSVQVSGGRTCQHNHVSFIPAGNPTAAIVTQTSATSPYFWASGAGAKAKGVMSSLSGGGELWAAVDLTTGALDVSSGMVIDRTRDYRNRLFDIKVVAGLATAGYVFPWTLPSTNTLTTNVTPSRGAIQNQLGVDTQMFTTSSMCEVAAGVRSILKIVPANMSNLAAATTVELRVDSTTGELTIFFTGAPNVPLFFWIKFSGQMENR